MVSVKGKKPLLCRVNLLFSWKSRFPLAGNACVARCCLLCFLGKGHRDDKEWMWWLRIAFPSDVKSELIPRSLPKLEFKDVQYRLFYVPRYRITDICVPQTVTCDQENPAS